MSDNIINVCLSTDRNYIQHAGTTIASVLENASSDDKLVFYILHKSLTEKDKKPFYKLKKIKDCEFNFIVPPSMPAMELHNHAYLSEACFYRLALPDMLPGVDRIIYFDCDVIALTSLRELWQIELSNNIVAAAADYMARIKEHCRNIGLKSLTYINSGVLLIDLKKARENNLTAELFRTAEEIKAQATFHDQDIINVTLQDRMLILPLKWNLSTAYYKRKFDIQYYSDEEIIEAAASPAIVHFSGRRKPWSRRSCRNPYWFEYFKALKRTPWRHKYFMGVLKRIFAPVRRLEGPAATLTCSKK
ncbi:MAG: glycosyltransferase family 8 protein [Lentisphaerae bacterium]|nr:glycosyltransferase family 8 protein [Lentisphaerota bacterium]MCP4103781.1 glycosyltransferase family 8 protein [Lentisphaerota bacterium]